MAPGSLKGRVTTAFFIAWRNLTRERRRWLLSASALAVAAMIVLSIALMALMAGYDTAFLSLHKSAQKTIASTRPTSWGVPRNAVAARRSAT